MKDCNEDTDTNTVLIKRFLFLLPQEHRNLYKNTLIQNSNGRFGNTFNYLYRKYDIRNYIELEQSQKLMKAPWNPADILRILWKYFNEAIIFKAFVEYDIFAGNALNLKRQRLP